MDPYITGQTFKFGGIAIITVCAYTVLDVSHVRVIRMSTHKPSSNQVMRLACNVAPQEMNVTRLTDNMQQHSA